MFLELTLHEIILNAQILHPGFYLYSVCNRSCEGGYEKTQTANCKELVKYIFPLSTPAFSWRGKCCTILNLDSVHFIFNLSYLETGQLQCFYTAAVSRSAVGLSKQEENITDNWQCLIFQMWRRLTKCNGESQSLSTRHHADGKAGEVS